MIVMDGIQVTLAGVVHNIQPHDLERYLQIGWERVVSDSIKAQALTPEPSPTKKTRKSK